eukprot:gnl/Chilomastix_cuspidata/288.p3 GENE.gnl/Chilomastix_cuspidata/288~~gnl/Chilomastix_cuspidata/288.p3  ORF type:complete len:327 (-),score=128.65 gnl/Chilomastix_cuspidata/288:732-1712(-)
MTFLLGNLSTKVKFFDKAQNKFVPIFISVNGGYLKLYETREQKERLGDDFVRSVNLFNTSIGAAIKETPLHHFELNYKDKRDIIHKYLIGSEDAAVTRRWYDLLGSMTRSGQRASTTSVLDFLKTDLTASNSDGSRSDSPSALVPVPVPAARRQHGGSSASDLDVPLARLRENLDNIYSTARRPQYEREVRKMHTLPDLVSSSLSETSEPFSESGFDAILSAAVAAVDVAISDNVLDSDMELHSFQGCVAREQPLSDMSEFSTRHYSESSSTPPQAVSLSSSAEKELARRPKAQPMPSVSYSSESDPQAPRAGALSATYSYSDSST